VYQKMRDAQWRDARILHRGNPFSFAGNPLERNRILINMLLLLRVRVRRCCSTIVVVLLLLAGAVDLRAQAPTQTSAPTTTPVLTGAPVTTPAPCEAVRPVAAEIAAAIDTIDLDHWKLPSAGKDQMGENVDSIRLDVSSTLPGLLDQAKAVPTELAPQWLVMQNVNALYDVLVRVTTTANLAASREDASLLTDVQNQLGETRKHLITTLIAATANQDREVAMLTARLDAHAKSGGGQPSKTIIVDDGIRPPVQHRTKKVHKPEKKTLLTPLPPLPTTGNVTP